MFSDDEVTSFVESMSNLLTTKYYIQETSGLISVSNSSKLHFTSSHSPLVGSHCGHIWKKCNEHLQLILSLYWFFFLIYFFPPAVMIPLFVCQSYPVIFSFVFMQEWCSGWSLFQSLCVQHGLRCITRSNNWYSVLSTVPETQQRENRLPSWGKTLI